MYLPRKQIGTFIIALMLLLMIHLGATLPYFPSPGWLYYGLAVVIAMGIIYWVGSEPKQDEKSQRKVEKLLREFDDDELDLLRSRLMREDEYDEREYESLPELVQSGKRKNEMR